MVLMLAGCQASKPTTQTREPSPSPSVRSPTSSPKIPGGRSAGLRIRDPRVTESSGLARSTVHPGVLYTHNDRGSPPYLFAVDRSGTRAVLRLNTPAEDWEDVASSADGRLWIGDIGDNDLTRSSVVVLVLEEPDPLVSTDLAVQRYTFAYPDGPHDAEALLVDPRDDRVFIVTKNPDGGRVFRAPSFLDSQRVNKLEDLGPAPPNVTAGDFSPDGEALVLRNQGRAFFFSRVGGTPVVVELPSQPQGESAAFTAEGRQVLVGSEGADSAVLRIPVPHMGR